MPGDLFSARGIYGNRGPADVAAYTLVEAASILGVHASTLQRWLKGRVLRTPEPRFLSFTNLVEAHVLAGLRKHRITLEKIRRAVRFVERHFKVQHALAREKFKTDGVDLFLDRLVDASCGQDALREILEAHLERVEYANGRAVRLFPLHREQAPKAVVVDPRRAFGRPVLHGTSVPIVDIASRFRRGDDIEQLARDFEVTPAEIQEALRATREAA